jgi:hypothetical protein
MQAWTCMSLTCVNVQVGQSCATVRGGRWGLLTSDLRRGRATRNVGMKELVRARVMNSISNKISSAFHSCKSDILTLHWDQFPPSSCPAVHAQHLMTQSTAIGAGSFRASFAYFSSGMVRRPRLLSRRRMAEPSKLTFATSATVIRRSTQEDNFTIVKTRTLTGVYYIVYFQDFWTSYSVSSNGIEKRVPEAHSKVTVWFLT